MSFILNRKRFKTRWLLGFRSFALFSTKTAPRFWENRLHELGIPDILNKSPQTRVSGEAVENKAESYKTLAVTETV
ncbi:MAG: hypothetical protein JOY54_19880 [Acidobacteriaceae bacterium]|nr:hypothetical protein [Acidobacteriaceae bacterium]